MHVLTEKVEGGATVVVMGLDVEVMVWWCMWCDMSAFLVNRLDAIVLSGLITCVTWFN